METVMAAVQFIEGVSAYRALWPRLMRKIVLVAGAGAGASGCARGPDHIASSTV